MSDHCGCWATGGENACLVDEDCNYKSLVEEVERLTAALEGQPVIKSEWEEKCEEVKRLQRRVTYFEEAGIEAQRERDEAEARIEAALAWLEPQSGVIKADPDQIIRGMAKALKGE